MTPYANAVLADTPVGWWRLTETDPLDTAVDASGNGNTGTYHGSGETLAVTGPLLGGDVSKAFTSAGAFWMFATSLAHYFSARQTLSVECWINTTDTTSPEADIIGWDGTHEVVIYNGGAANAHMGNTDVTALAIIADSNWHHLVATFSGDGVGNGTVSLYVDTVLIAETAVFAGGVLPTDSTTPFAVAAGAFVSNIPTNSPVSPYIGTVAEPAVYPQVLSLARVQAHYVAAGYSLPTTGTVRAQSWFMGYDE